MTDAGKETPADLPAGSISMSIYHLGLNAFPGLGNWIFLVPKGLHWSPFKNLLPLIRPYKMLPNMVID